MSDHRGRSEGPSPWRQRERVASEHPYRHLTLLQQSDGAQALAHGSAGVAMLPGSVRMAGDAAIDALAAYLCSLWPSDGRGQSLDNAYLRGYIDLLGIGELLPQLQARICVRDVAAQVHEVCARLKRNPMLVVLFAELADLEAAAGPQGRIFPFRDEESAHDDLRDAVVYCALQEAIGLECLLAPKASTDAERENLLQARLFAILERRRDEIDWRAVCNLFELLKVELIVRPMKQRLQAKQGLDESGFDDRSGDGILLQLNILDAMYGDTQDGSDDNAACGFELMCQTSDKPPEPLLGEQLNDEWMQQGQATGVTRMHIAFNEAWVSLYSSWNGCFCANYGDLMYPKLYNLGVAGTYLDIDDKVYFFPRICTLYTHLHMMIFKRVATGRQLLHAQCWEDPALRSLWGRINRVAAQAYQQRVEAALQSDLRKRLSYKAWRTAKHAFWVPLRTAIQGAAKLGLGAAEVQAQIAQFLDASSPEANPPGSGADS